MPEFLQRFMRRVVQGLIEVSSPRFAMLFMIVAVVISVMIVLAIDLLWDGRFSAELLFAGVVTPIIDGLLLVLFVIAMLNAIRAEARWRRQAEDEVSALNAALEAKVQERTRELRAAQEELVRTEKLALLGQLADTVGHELRNPLGVMNNAVYYLKAVLADADETTREYLDIIEEEIADAERIVSDLLDAVRTKSPQPERVAVGELLRQALRKCAVPPSVTVRLEIPDGLPAIRVDPTQMRQVFWNLITNGLEAMASGGELEIGASEERSTHTVSVSVKDGGDGITPEHRARLFEPMFTTKPRRVGLGLVVVKNLTLANGGSVEVDSVPGKGSVFTVRFPYMSESTGDARDDLRVDEKKEGGRQ